MGCKRLKFIWSCDKWKGGAGNGLLLNKPWGIVDVSDNNNPSGFPGKYGQINEADRGRFDPQPERVLALGAPHYGEHAPPTQTYDAICWFEDPSSLKNSGNITGEIFSM